jgi:hypothetical protein
LTIKAIFIAAFFGLTLGARQELPASAASAAIPASTSAPAPSRPSASAVDPSPQVAASGACGAGMILVDGDYCPDVAQTCLKWMDPPPYQNLRCAEYAKPTKCKVAKVPKRFCIDREEYTDGNTKNDAGDDLPVVRKSWLDAKAICEARSARLCKESEWELACEGPDMSPYPYGWTRDSTVCNFDRTDLGGTTGTMKVLPYPLRIRSPSSIVSISTKPWLTVGMTTAKSFVSLIATWLSSSNSMNVICVVPTRIVPP